MSGTVKTDIADHKTMPKLLKENSLRFADRIALREKDLGIWQRTTWQGYWEHVRDFALGLRELGLTEPGDKVSILGDNSPQWLYADLAAQSCRAVAVLNRPTEDWIN